MKKKSYIKPQLLVIELDAEISLQLQSTPPTGPNELVGMVVQTVFKEIV